MPEVGQLRPIEMRLLEELTGMRTGYVLDFSDNTFGEFFAVEVGIDIYDDAYAEFGGSKGKRLRGFVARAQPTKIARALSALWEYREDYLRRERRLDDVEDGLARLNRLILRLGGGPISDEGAVTPETPLQMRLGPNTMERQTLRDAFQQLHRLDPHPRGVAFQHFLERFFEAWELQARGSFRNRGEEIDGSFSHGGQTYLLEAKWEKAPTNAQTLHGFQGKVSERPEWARGLFISYAGFSPDTLSAFTARRIRLMDGADIMEILMRDLSFTEVLSAKLRHAAERKDPIGRVSALFPARPG